MIAHFICFDHPVLDAPKEATHPQQPTIDCTPDEPRRPLTIPSTDPELDSTN